MSGAEDALTPVLPVDGEKPICVATTERATHGGVFGPLYTQTPLRLTAVTMAPFPLVGGMRSGFRVAPRGGASGSSALAALGALAPPETRLALRRLRWFRGSAAGLGGEGNA